MEDSNSRSKTPPPRLPKMSIQPVNLRGKEMKYCPHLECQTSYFDPLHYIYNSSLYSLLTLAKVYL